MLLLSLLLPSSALEPFAYRSRFLLAVFVTNLFSCALANVEKLIFIPTSTDFTPLSDGPHVKLDLRLSPASPRLWTSLNTSFPEFANTRIGGFETWVALEGLNPGQRYELRICWAAISSSDFTLRLHAPADAALSLSKPAVSLSRALMSTKGLTGYVQILSRADYYTLDESRSQHPDSVHVELVLDSYIFNILPKSLLQIGVVVAGVALWAWWISLKIYLWISSIMAPPVSKPKVS
ncbi:hypothetical protein BDZ91DRAFT_722380 [Kalaharituber pfeilii]|nr:hypothetical protein BDZ91DRAFT_722380 [Kalaharituber pfeilii]